MKLSSINDGIIVWGAISKRSLPELKQQQSLIIVPESRPYLLGLKHNIPLLKKAGIDFIYCPDNALGLLFYKAKIKKTFIFSNAKTKKGTIGLSGSLYVALLSKLHKVQVKIISGGKINLEAWDKDVSTLEGKDFILEEEKEKYIIEPAEEFIPQEVQQ